MGILRTREEYLPVTCAILKAEDREAFFSTIKKHSNSRPEHMARLCETTVDAVNDWISGKANVPYHSLQTLAHNYETPIPPVGELRREYMAISQLPSRHETPTPPSPSKKTREAAKQPREEAPRRGRGKAAKPRREPRRAERPEARREEGSVTPPQAQPEAREERPRQPQQPQAKGQQPRNQQPRGQQQRGQQQRGQQPQRQKQPQRGGSPAPQGPRVPEPTEQLAFWVGITIVTGRREAEALIMSADRRIGQNFAGIWANLTRELFGVKPTLAMLDNGKIQEARLPVAGFEDFLDRLDFKDSKAFNEAGVPRWAWSNPAWKAACLKGVVDGRAFFQRAPSLVLESIPERLAKALQKMLSAFQLEAVAGPNGALELKGVETLDKYFEKVGTGNMKLRDQYRAFRHPRDGRPAPEDSGRPGPYTGAPAAPATVPVAGAEEADAEVHDRVLAEEVEAADDQDEIHEEAVEAAAEPQAEAAPAATAAPASPQDPDDAADAAAARKAHASAQPSRFGDPPPQPKKAPAAPGGGRRKTLYRGRPRR